MEGINLSTFFMGFASAFFTIHAVQMLSRPHRTRFQTMLGWVLAVWALFNWKDIVLTYPQLYNHEVLCIVMLVDGWSAITYTVFIFEVTTPGWFTWRKVGLLFLPFMLFTAAYIVWPSDKIIYAYCIFLWFYAWTVVIIAFFRVKRYMRYVRNNYSNIDRIDISWLRVVFAFCIVSQLSWLATSLLANVYVDSLYYASTIVMWQLVISYTAHFHPVAIEVQPAAPPVRDYPFSSQFQAVVTSEDIFLNKELTLGDLASALGTNRTYMSNYFNDVLGTSFYDYINYLRITRKSVPMIQTHPEYTLEHIASESGFNSMSTFRRAFMRTMGKSPSSYRHELAEPTA